MDTVSWMLMLYLAAFLCRYIADGIIPHAHFCSSVRQRTTAAAGANGKSSTAVTAASANWSSAKGATATGHADSAGVADDVCAVPNGVRERFVFMRGVQWSAHDIDSVSW